MQLASFVGVWQNVFSMWCETVLEKSKLDWDKLIPPQILGIFFSIDLEEWIHLNLNVQGYDLEWGNTWPTGCHANWARRNKEIHMDNFARPLESGNIIAARIRDYRNAIMLQNVALGRKQNVEITKWSS